MKYIAILWISICIISLIGNKITINSIIQFLEINFYIILTILMYDLFYKSPDIENILRSLILSSFHLSVYNIMNLGDIDNVIGINESSFVIFLFGVLLPLYFYDITSKYRWLFLIFYNLTILIILDARAATLITIIVLLMYMLHVYFKKSLKYSILNILILLIFIYSSESYNNIYTQFIDKVAIQSTSTQERIAMTLYGLDLYLNKPINGYGIGSIEQLMNLSRHSFSRHPHPHNNFVYLILEYGTFGIFLIFFFFYCIYKKTKIVNDSLFRFKFLFLISFILFSLTNVIFYGANRMIPFCILFSFTMYLNIYYLNSKTAILKYDYTPNKR